MTIDSDAAPPQGSRKGKVVDIVLAVSFLVLGLVQLFTEGGPAERGPGGIGALLVGAQTLPLIWRRRSPLYVLVVVTVAASIPPFIGHLGDNIFSLIAVVAAVYTVAAYASARAAIAGVLIALAGGLLHQVPQMEQFDPLFLAFAWVPMGGAAFIGSQIQLERRRMDVFRHSAEIAIWKKDQQARRAISEERARVARELHDLVAHNMTSMALQAGAARLYFDSNPEQAREVLKSIESGSRKALTEMRRLLGVLRTDEDQSLALAPQPSLSQLDDLVESSRAAGLNVNLSIEGEPLRLSPGLDLTAYRILQEALTNSLKHGSHQEDAEVLVRYLPEHLELSVENHLPPGSRSSDRQRDGGQGLVGIKERVALFKGDLRAGVGGNGRFRIWVQLPLESVA